MKRCKFNVFFSAVWQGQIPIKWKNGIASVSLEQFCWWYICIIRLNIEVKLNWDGHPEHSNYKQMVTKG